MVKPKSNESWLIADVGATFCRCGLYSAADRAIHAVQVYRNDTFTSLQTLLAEYLSTQKL